MEEDRPHQKSLLVLWLFIVFSRTTDCGTSPVVGPEHKLYTHLFADYAPDSRPVRNASHRVVVNFDLSLNQLLDLDEKNQILTTSVWIFEEWTDEMLKWSPDDYNDQRAIMIPATSVWLPDIFIFNTANANMDGFVNVNGSKVAVQYTGNVKWMVPLMISSVCAVDVTYFPYDRQTCTIKFGSWIYDIEQLEIISEATEPDLEQYVMNSEYDLRNVSISRGILEGSCCPGDGRHSMVELRIELGRKSLYYDYIVIAPTIMLCVLTLASFLLPCDRGEKMAIGLTVFLTLYVLQLRIADNVPDTNSTPILGVFLLIVMTFNCVSLIMATIVMNIKKRGDDSPCPTVPNWLFFLCHKVFGRIVCTRYLWKDQIPCPGLLSDSEKRLMNSNNRKLDESHDAVTSSKNGTYKLSSTKSSRGLAETQTSFTEQDIECRTETENSTGKGESSNTVAHQEQRSATDYRKPAEHVGKKSMPENSSGKRSDDFQKPKQLHREEETEMRFRKPKQAPSECSTYESSQQQLSGEYPTGLYCVDRMGVDVSKSYLMKRRWFYVAEVVDKFLFLIYLVLLTCSIFTVLFLIPVYFRNDK